MKAESLSLVLSIVGVFISFALIINGFFIKQMISSLSQVEKGLAVLMEKHNGTAQIMNISESRIEKLEGEVISIRKRLHELGNFINGFGIRLDMKDKFNE